jgi:hypothetical protein
MRLTGAQTGIILAKMGEIWDIGGFWGYKTGNMGRGIALLGLVYIGRVARLFKADHPEFVYSELEGYDIKNSSQTTNHKAVRECEKHIS